MRLPPEDVARNEMLANRDNDLGLTMWDGMAAAANEAWRAGATSAIDRGIKNLKDKTNTIDIAQANEQYGLIGTEAEIQPDEQLTEDDLQARIKDHHQLKLNAFITDTVNDESPTMGRVSQFVAGMAASMVDPVSLATNIAGGALLAKAGTSIAGGGKVLNALNPAVAKAVVTTYGNSETRSLMHIVAREGIENFITSSVEEGIIQGVDLGQERLARKITVGESIQNVVAGTMFGTAFSTAITKEGRNAVARSFGRMFGDDAPDMARSMNLITAEEMKLGVEKSGIENKFYDRETFEARPWYKEPSYVYSDTLPNKLYISLDENGAMHSYSHRGNGVTLTDNKIHAMNKGAKVLEVDASNLRLMDNQDFYDAKGRPTKVADQVMEELSADIVAKADPSTLGKILHLMKDHEAEIDDMKFNRNQARKMLKQEMEGKSLDDIMDLLDGITSRHQMDYDPAMKLEEVTNKLGFNGYAYKGKNAQGQAAYKGVYVNSQFTKKLQKKGELEVPKGETGDQVIWKHQEEQMMAAHAKWLQTDARKLAVDLKDPEVAGLPKETPLETAPKTAEGQAMLGTVEKAKAFQAVKNRIDTEINTKVEQAKAAQPEPKEGAPKVETNPEDVVDPELLATQKIMDLLQKGQDHETIVKQQLDTMDKWINCKLGV